MFVEFSTKSNGNKYAYLTKSVRDGKKVKKERITLGRVLDEDKMIFRSRSRGVFTYDPKTDTYGNPPDDFIAEPVKRSRKEKLILDFGDAYILSNFIKANGLEPAVDALGYGNMDSVYAMILYYILCDTANSHAEEWYDGSYARILYPNANIYSQRISDLFTAIGDEYSEREFFKKYLEWFKSNFDNAVDPNILIDSTGMPNSNHMAVNAVSNHNGIVEDEIRLIYATQKETGMPLYMRYIPGNIQDKTTLAPTIAEIESYGIKVSSCVLDAGYPNYQTMEYLFAQNINFLSRLGKTCKKLYNAILDEGREGLEEPENAVLHNGRIMYVKKVAFSLSDYCSCDENFIGYGYVCLDKEVKDCEINRAARKAALNNAEIFKKEQSGQTRGRPPKKEKGVITGTDLLKEANDAGLFILVSSYDETTQNVLSNYAMRDKVEKIFELDKSEAKLLPLNVEKEETLRGHLMITFIASAIITLMERELKMTGMSWESAKIIMRNQKCKVFDTYSVAQEASAKLNKLYKQLKMTCPVKL